MSGIAGIYRFSGKPVDEQDIYPMVNTMNHRGPDGIHVWCGNNVGFGHCMLHTTPDSLDEHLPYVDTSRGLVITSDARIDNRKELVSSLGRIDQSGRVVPDSELILEAYKKWGEDCVDHLIGAFAFAIWDRREGLLFCARDHLGVKPFYYFHKPVKVFAFGTEVKSLFCLSGVSRAYNEVAIGDILGFIREDKENTLYESIYRLPPAHVLSVSSKAFSMRRYWTLEPNGDLDASNDEEYVEHFLEIFEEAVRCRTRSAFPVASQLSGGLDSSFVTAVADAQVADKTLHTLSLIYTESEECDERGFIRDVLAERSVNDHYVDVDQFGPLRKLGTIYRFLDDGVATGMHYGIWEMLRVANSEGARVVLDGIDGDTTVMHGFGRFRELALEGDWKEFYREAKCAEERHRHAKQRHSFTRVLSDRFRILKTYGFPVLEEHATKGSIDSFVRAVWEISSYFNLSQRSLYRRFWRRLLAPEWLVRQRDERRGQKKGKDKLDYVDDEFARRIKLYERYDQMNYRNVRADTVRETQYRKCASGSITSTLEKSNHYSAAWGLESRHPFMDIRLLSFCLGLPSSQSYSAGWTRAIMRQAMKGYVPDSVRLRPGKANVSTSNTRALFEVDQSFLERAVLEPGEAEPYLDLDHLRAQFRRGAELYDEGKRVPMSVVVSLGNIASLIQRLKTTACVPKTDRQLSR